MDNDVKKVYDLVSEVFNYTKLHKWSDEDRTYIAQIMDRAYEIGIEVGKTETEK